MVSGTILHEADAVPASWRTAATAQRKSSLTPFLADQAQWQGRPVWQPQPHSDAAALAARQPQVQPMPEHVGQWQEWVVVGVFMSMSSMVGVRTSIRGAIVRSAPRDRLNPAVVF